MSGNLAIRPPNALLIGILLILASAWATGVLLPGNPVFASSGWEAPTESQNVYAVAVSPAFASDGTVYAGTKTGGVRRSTDSGATWSAVNTGFFSNFPSVWVTVLAISPNFQNDNTLFSAAATKRLA